MNDLIDVIQTIVKNYISNMELTDYVAGTVTRINPLEVTIVNTMLPLSENVLILTDAVIGKQLKLKIAGTGHIHIVENLGHDHTTDDKTTSAYTLNLTVPENQTDTYTHDHTVNDTQTSVDEHAHAVQEIEIPSDTHDHIAYWQTTSANLTGSYETEESTENIAVYENGDVALTPDEDGYVTITISNPLQLNDKVIMMRVLSGQNYIILSKTP